MHDLTVSCSADYINSVSVITWRRYRRFRRVIGMDLATRNADDVFAELICADAQWLREEFDALIAASFRQPPAARPPAPPRIPRRRPPRPPGHQRPRHGPPAMIVPAIMPGQSRQRSPPA
jgi:hypothetical protein